MVKDPISVPYKIGPHHVAGVWRYMLPQDLAKMVIPSERRSTCMDCPKVVSDDFRPDYRCCTYHPRVPNFLIGLALLHDPKAERLFTQLIEQGYMTPEGMVSSPLRWADYVTEVAKEKFGKSESVLCPLLDTASGFCNIYAFRNSVCSTFYCHNDNGAKGEKFWEAVQSLASQCELALSQWAMEEIGFPVGAYMARLNRLSAQQASEPKTHAWSAESRKLLWDNWYGREKEFFLKIGQLISEQRHRLWEIANENDILEALKFDKKALSVIPAQYREEAAAELEGANEEGETISPRKLWQKLKAAHNSMWTVPGGKLQLNPRSVIAANPRLDPEEKFYSRFSHMVSFHTRKGSASLDWREFISDEIATALARFASPQQVSGPLLAELEALLGQDPLYFLAEWAGKKVLSQDHTIA